MSAKTPQIPSFTARTGLPGQVNLETRVRQLEERLESLEAIIQIDGTRVDIKTSGRMSIKAASLDLDAGHASSSIVKVGGKVVALKGDRVTGETVTNGGVRFLRQGKIE